MNNISISWGKAALILFGALILWLAGIYLGSFFIFLYYSYIGIIILSLIQVFWSMSFVKIHQGFSTEHPVKGEAIQYSITLANESIIPSCNLKLYYALVQPGVHIEDDAKELYLGFKDEYRNRFVIHCPYRGIYTVGLEFLEFRDLAGIVRIFKPVKYRTFYVLPRVIKIESPLKSISNRFTASSSTIGLEYDYGQFESFKPYRTGESIRHISWKKYITTGFPLLKEYGKTSEPGMRIYLDTRRSTGEETNFLEMEDCSIEILVALVKYCIDNSIPVSVRSVGRHEFDFNYFSGQDKGAFHSFHKHTSEIEFSEHNVSPLSLFESDIELDGDWGGSVLFITDHNDMEIYEFVEHNVSNSEMYTAIINRSGFSEIEKKQSSYYFESLKDKGAMIFTVESANTIAEDLRR